MEEMLIIPRAEAPEVIEKHSSLLMEDGQLSHAARLAAQQKRFLNDPTLPDDVAVQRVKPVGRKLRRAVKKIRQLKTQPLTAEEEAQEGQELITPALTKWMNRMARAAAQPVPAVVAAAQAPRPKPKPTPPPKRRRQLPATPITPQQLMEVTLTPTPPNKKKKTPGPAHLKAGITPEALQGQSKKLRKTPTVPRTTRQTNPLMASLSREMDTRRKALNPDQRSSRELKELERGWSPW